MMNKKHVFFLASIALFSAISAQASEVRVEWIEPDNFRDIRAGSFSQQRFEENVLQELSDQFEESAQGRLSAEQTLYVQVTDLDLAGRIDYSFRNHTPVRVVRNIDFPRITFSYEIKNEAGITVASGEENIKDMGFNTPYYRNFNSDALHYEKALIEDWFKTAF